MHKHIVCLLILQLDMAQCLHVLPIHRTIHIYMKLDLTMYTIMPLIEGMMYLQVFVSGKT